MFKFTNLSSNPKEPPAPSLPDLPLTDISSKLTSSEYQTYLLLTNKLAEVQAYVQHRILELSVQYWIPEHIEIGGTSPFPSTTTIHKLINSTNFKLKGIIFPSVEDGYPLIQTFDLIQYISTDRFLRALEIITSKKYQLIIDPPSPLRTFPINVRVLRATDSKVPVVYDVQIRADRIRSEDRKEGKFESSEKSERTTVFDRCFTCTCPDYSRRRVVCKHILAAGVVLGQMHISRMEEEELRRMEAATEKIEKIESLKNLEESL